MSDLQDKIVKTEEHKNDEQFKETVISEEHKNDEQLEETFVNEEDKNDEQLEETFVNEEDKNDQQVEETFTPEQHIEDVNVNEEQNDQNRESLVVAEEKNNDDVENVITTEENINDDNIGDTSLNIEQKDDDDIQDILTSDEQTKIDSIQKVSFVKEEPKPEKKDKKPFNFWSIFGFNSNSVDLSTVVGGIGSRPYAPFDIQRGMGLKKVVTINNISGKNAYLILTPAPIKNIKKVATGASVGGVGASIDVDFEDKGEYKAQKISIANNTRSEYDLDNDQFYCTLFLNIDNEWKKIWDNRRFNGRKYDINILERHANAALGKDAIPDF
jgi:hypothetical protein